MSPAKKPDPVDDAATAEAEASAPDEVVHMEVDPVPFDGPSANELGDPSEEEPADDSGETPAESVEGAEAGLNDELDALRVEATGLGLTVPDAWEVEKVQAAIDAMRAAQMDGEAPPPPEPGYAPASPRG